jgi:tetratricopeptide (TPR) repeat protein
MSVQGANSVLGVRITAPLVGRDEVLRELGEVFAYVEQGHTALVTIVGAAGIGKSRLVADVVSLHVDSGSHGFQVYQAPQRSSDKGYGAIGRILRGRLGIQDGADVDRGVGRLRREVMTVLGERDVDDVCFFIGQLAGIDYPSTPMTRAVSDDPVEANLIRRAIVRRFMEADAAKLPVCLVVEDLHQVDADSLDLLDYLAKSLRGRAVILCTARPEIVSRAQNWFDHGENWHRRIDLPPLTDEQSTKLMEHLLQPCAGSSKELLVEAAVAMAQGNPGLLERMVRIFHDCGVLQESSEPGLRPFWKVDVQKLTSVRLPMTAEDAVTVRVSTLSAADRRVLEYAAAMGSVFWFQGLLALTRAERETPEIWNPNDVQDAAALRSALDDLIRRDYVLELPESIMADDREYVFQHTLEREQIAALTSAATRRRYHQTIADFLSHREGVREHEETCAMLAQHLERAGSRTRAGMAYLDAGDRARVTYAARKACEHYQRGLALIGDSDAERRMDALHNLGDCYVLLGKTDEALQAFREMLSLAFRLDRRAKGGAAHNRLGRLFRDSGSFEVARKHLDAGLSLFEATEDNRGISACHDDIGKLLWLTGDYTNALEHMRQALNMRKEIGDPRSIALSMNNIGLVWMDHGSSKKAREAFESALKIRREIGDPLGMSESLANLGGLAQDNNDWAAALRFYEEAHTLARGVGERNRIAGILTAIGTTQYHLGNTTEAIRVLEEAEERCDELDDKLHLAESLRGLAKAYLLHGDLAKARDKIKRSVELFGNLRSKPHLAIALRTLAEVTAAGAWGEGHESKVVDYFMRSIVICKEIGNDLEVARSYRAFSGYVLGKGHYDQNPDIVREAETLDRMADEIFARHQVELDSQLTEELALGGGQRAIEPGVSPAGSRPSHVAPASPERH